MSDEIKLTKDQEKLILDAFRGKENPPSITDLVRLAFPELKNADGRCLEAKAIKQLLIQKNLKAVTKTVYIPKTKILLDDSQKEFVRNNYSKMPILDVAQTLFQNSLLNNSDKEVRAVADYIEDIKDESEVKVSDELKEIPDNRYTPPKSVEGVWRKIDRYILNHGIDKAHPTAQQKAGMEALLTYMSSFRFGHQMNLYSSQTDRDLFESSFVRYTYDKPDLESEEIDLFINCSLDNVNLASAQKRIESLNALLADSTKNAAAEDRARISMGLIEAVKALNDDFNKTSKRQSDMFAKLTVSRADKQAEKKNNHSSILNLIGLWKGEQNRKKLLHLADARNKLLEKGLHDLSEMDAVKAMILGISPEELNN